MTNVYFVVHQNSIDLSRTVVLDGLPIVGKDTVGKLVDKLVSSVLPLVKPVQQR
jgi:hypothetical protein